MSKEASVTPSRGELARALLVPALSMLCLPALGLAFARYAGERNDARFTASVLQHIDTSSEVPPEQRPMAKAFYTQHPPSSACASTEPELAEFRASVCELGSAPWQFFWAGRGSGLALVLGLVGLAGALGLGAVAARWPRAQYVCLLSGWLMLSVLAAVETALQATVATWMSFWVTALAFNIYVPKLILLIGFLAAVGVWTAVRGIFRRIPSSSEVEGELVSRDEGPGLWERLGQLAARVGTSPPAAVVAGIDANFFVTEAGLTVNGERLDGRALYVSLPLLRTLSASEADAVLAHELAHFRGGDTVAGARIGPTLVRYDAYLEGLRQSAFTLPAFYVMRMFRVVFELAHQRDRRNRELIADRVAVEATSAPAMAGALLKTTAYASHRASLEGTLFQKDARHTEALGLKERVASGLVEHVSTDEFQKALADASVPHPFDSHPPLEERLASVGAALSIEDCRRLVEERPERTWADEVTTASAIEDRLWSAYEARFAAAHERSLAYRYLPADDAQRALVERHFPARTFTLKDGGALRLDFEGIEVDGARLPFRDIASAKIDDGNFATYLVLGHTLESEAGKGPTRINLRALGKAPEQEVFKGLFAAYLHRDQVARSQPPGDPTPA